MEENAVYVIEKQREALGVEICMHGDTRQGWGGD